MANTIELHYSVYHGPSIVAPFAAVVADFSCPPVAAIASATLAERLRAVLPRKLLARIRLPHTAISVVDALPRLITLLGEAAELSELSIGSRAVDDKSCRIVLAYLDAAAAIELCQAARLVAEYAFVPDPVGGNRTHAVAAALAQADAVQSLRQPDYIARALMRVARKRNIPVYAVSPGSRIWRYGQGSAGINFFEAANEFDSFPASHLIKNKFLSNQLVVRLGLPGVQHVVVMTAAAAQHYAQSAGFPLVVKPLDRGKGLGVTTNITNDEELAHAFTKAQPLSRSGVIVERQVDGDDHRIAVVGGQFKWAVRRMPPRITGNGLNTVRELIERDNARRKDADAGAGFISRLTLDDDLLSVLAKQGLSLDDQPAAGRSIRLRTIANSATGGTIVECSEDVHPDNREMVEAIARNFHMDTLGIDYMTTDVSRSWRDMPSAIIEINAMPGFSSDARAEIILADKFAPGSDGRVPSVMLIDADSAVGEAVADLFDERGLRVGRSDETKTYLHGRERRITDGGLAARVTALVLDAACDALLIHTTSASIERFGLPLDRCDVALVGYSTSRSQAVFDLIATCSTAVVQDLSVTSVETAIAHLLDVRKKPGA